MTIKLKERVFCKECQEKFDEQEGQLLLLDMCGDCKESVLYRILQEN